MRPFRRGLGCPQLEIVVGESGFEPEASCSQSRRSDLAELHPEVFSIRGGRVVALRLLSKTRALPTSASGRVRLTIASRRRSFGRRAGRAHPRLVMAVAARGAFPARYRRQPAGMLGVPAPVPVLRADRRLAARTYAGGQRPGACFLHVGLQRERCDRDERRRARAGPGRRRDQARAQHEHRQRPGRRPEQVDDDVESRAHGPDRGRFGGALAFRGRQAGVRRPSQRRRWRTAARSAPSHRGGAR